MTDLLLRCIGSAGPREWTPAQLSDLALWLDAADTASITLNSGNVSQWNDKSGNARHAVQGTAASQPALTAIGLGGKPVITFDGTDDFMDVVTTVFQGTGNFSLHWVFARLGAGSGGIDYRPCISSLSTAPVADRGAFHFVKNSSNRPASDPFFGATTASPAWGSYDLTTGATYTNNQASIMSFNAGATNWSVFRNGSQEGTNARGGAILNTVNGLRLAQQESPLRTSNIYLAEIVLVSNEDTSSRQLLEGYLAWKWGLTYALPANHPYRWDTSLFGGTNLNGFDSDAKTYIASVETADVQELEIGVKTAINSFIVGAKADGIWDAIKASCIMAGARTLTGALQPLKGTAPTNNNFVSGDYNRKTGLVGDGSTKYLDSNRNNNADPQNSRHAAVYASTRNTETAVRAYIRATFQAGVGATQILSGVVAQKISSRCSDSTTTTSSGNLHSSNGFFGISRNLSTSYTARGSGISETITQVSAAPGNGNYFVFAGNNQNAITVDLYSNARLSFYSFGESLDLALLDTRVTNLINQINGAIP